MPSATALVAEQSSELRKLIATALQETGFVVLQAGTCEGFERELRWLATHARGSVLLILASERLMAQSACGLLVILGIHVRRRLERVLVVVTTDAASTFAAPHVYPCELVAVLVKPFDLGEVRKLFAAIVDRASITSLHGRRGPFLLP